MADPRIAQKIRKLSLEQLVAPKTKKVLKKKKFKIHIDGVGARSLGHRSDKINKIVPDYNPKYKVNIHESIVIWINDKQINGGRKPIFLAEDIPTSRRWIITPSLLFWGLCMVTSFQRRHYGKREQELLDSGEIWLTQLGPTDQGQQQQWPGMLTGCIFDMLCPPPNPEPQSHQEEKIGKSQKKDILQNLWWALLQTNPRTWGESEELSQTRGAQEAVPTRCNVSWMGPWDRKWTENGHGVKRVKTKKSE